MQLDPVARRTVVDAVYDQLSSEILAGRPPVGELLPSERRLTETLGVNRQAVREALKRLGQAGLVDVQHGGGTRVADYRRTAGLDLLEHLLVRDGLPDPAVIRSVMELRATLGPDVAARAAGRATPDLVDGLRRALDSMAAADGDLPLLARLDLVFWERLVEGSDNIAYQLAYNSLRRVWEPAVDLAVSVIAVELADLDTRAAIVDSVAAGDAPAAADAARRLLAQGTAAVSELLAGLGSGEPGGDAT